MPTASFNSGGYNCSVDTGTFDVAVAITTTTTASTTTATTTATINAS